MEVTSRNKINIKHDKIKPIKRKEKYKMEYENDQDLILTKEDLKGLDKPNDEGGWGAPTQELKKTVKHINNEAGLML